VTHNQYTTLTPADLEKSAAVIKVALDKRNSAFATELARQRANDALCKEFARLADPFVKYFVDQKEIISNSKAELEDQLKYVNGKLASMSTDGKNFGPINDCNAKMEAAGITNNRYTTLTAKDVQVQWEQYQAFLKKKQKMLEEEIEHHKLKGVTPEQFAEIDNNFNMFDADKSGFIDKKELKACLYSLGEEKSKGEVDQIMKEFGSSDVNGIKKDSFKNFMVGLLGVSDTKDDILNGFGLINKHVQGTDEITKPAAMEPVMDEPDINYIKTTAKPLKDGYNYRTWTEDVFSR